MNTWMVQIHDNASVLSPICRKDRFYQDNLLNYNMAKMQIDKITICEKKIIMKMKLYHKY